MVQYKGVMEKARLLKLMPEKSIILI